MLRYATLAVVIALTSAFSASAQEAARLVRVHATHNVLRGGQKGILIQIDSQIDGLKNRPVILGAFFRTANGQKLLARPGAYSTPDGQVSAQVVVTPRFDLTNVTNTELFVPYDELSLGVRGTHCFNFRVQILHFNGSGWVTLHESVAAPFALRQD